MPVQAARIYYDNPVNVSVVAYNGTNYTSTWQYNGPGKAYNSSGGSFTNVYILTPENYLAYEKRGSPAQLGTSYNIRGGAYVTAGTTYTSLGITIGYLDWVVSPVTAEQTLPQKLSGISLGFSTTQYPTSMTITYTFCLPSDLNTTRTLARAYSNSASLFSVDFSQDSTIRTNYNDGYILKTATINFNVWSSSNYPVVSYIAPYLIKDYVYSNGLIGYKSGLQSSTDSTTPSFGIIPGYGELKLKDLDSSIEFFSEIGSLKERQRVKLYLDSVLVGWFVSEDWNYDSKSKDVSVSLIDDLLDLQNITWKGSKVFYPTTLYNVWSNTIYSSTPFSQRLIPSIYYHADYTSVASTLFYGITYNAFYLETDTYWNNLNKILKSAGLVMFKEQKESVLSGTYYIIKQKLLISTVDYSGYTDIVIPPDRIYGEPTKTIINKNYISGVTYDLPIIAPVESKLFQETRIPIFTVKTSTSVGAGSTIYDVSFLNNLLLYNSANNTESGFPESFVFAPNNYDDFINYYGNYQNYADSVGYAGLITPSFGPTDIYTDLNELVSINDVNNITMTLYAEKYRGNFVSNVLNPTSFTKLANVSLPISSKSINTSTGRVTVNYNTPSGTTYDGNSNLAQLRCNWFYDTFGGYATLPFISFTYAKDFYLTLTGLYYKQEIKTGNIIGTTKNIYSMETSEVMNDNAVYSTGEQLAKYMATKILNGYQGGRQTAEITCFYGLPYYSTTGLTLMTGIDGEIFRPGESVIPKVYKNGVLTALAKNKDGTDKIYVITGSEFEYYGMPLMHLKLIEEGV